MPAPADRLSLSLRSAGVLRPIEDVFRQTGSSSDWGPPQTSRPTENLLSHHTDMGLPQTDRGPSSDRQRPSDRYRPSADWQKPSSDRQRPSLRSTRPFKDRQRPSLRPTGGLQKPTVSHSSDRQRPSLDRQMPFLVLIPTKALLNPRRHRPFRILPRHTGGGGGTTPRAVPPLIVLELREKKNERVARRETKRLVYKLKVLVQPVTSEVRSSAKKWPKPVIADSFASDGAKAKFQHPACLRDE